MVDCFADILPDKIFIRADAGPDIGYGHVKRTMAVADRLRSVVSTNICYLMQARSDISVVRDAGYDIYLLPDKSWITIADMIPRADGPLILDSYELKESDLAKLHNAGYCIIFFDDGKRFDHYSADAVIDYSPGARNLDYRGLDHTFFCLGPSYFPLRQEFLERYRKQNIKSYAKKIVVTFGASDPDDQTCRLLKLFASHEQKWDVTIVLGPGYHGAVGAMDKPEWVTVRHNVEDMAAVISHGDLVISGAGGTALECVHLGLPMLHLVLSHDQEPIASAMSMEGVSVNLGRYNEITDEDIWKQIVALSIDVNRLNTMCKAGQHMVDGDGANRIATLILKIWNKFHRRDLFPNTNVTPPDKSDIS